MMAAALIMLVVAFGLNTISLFLMFKTRNRLREE